VTILVRSPDRAAETRDVLAAHPSGPRVRVGSLADDPVQGDVVVSTIPAAAQDVGLLARCAGVPVVFEVLYDPWPTPLAAAASGRILVGGLDLLVHQAALQFLEFTGLPAPLAAMRGAGETALSSRRDGR
jgi:shikimate dehydrogenase